MTTIYLIRHAEAEGNLYRIAQGQCDSMITDRGYQQIGALAARFRDVPIDAVYASDLTRTCITAGAIAATHHLPIQKKPALREICVGRWEEKTWGEIALTEQQMLSDFTLHLEKWRVEGAETPAAVLERVTNALLEIGRENAEKTAAVFCHGCAIRLALGALEGRTLAEIGSTPHGDNTAVSKLTYENGALRLVYRDDNTHVKALSLFKEQSWWKRPNAVEPGLYFRPLELPRQASALTDCVERGRRDAGDLAPVQSDLFVREAAERVTLCAYLEGTMAGILQLDPQKEASEKNGWISLYCMEPSFRKRGLGVQMLGQAVLYYRAHGRERLRISLAPENEAAVRFFTRYGFSPEGDAPTVYTKSLLPHAWVPETEV